jgi:hypothetical protein
MREKRLASGTMFSANDPIVIIARVTHPDFTFAALYKSDIPPNKAVRIPVRSMTNPAGSNLTASKSSRVRR